MNACIRVVGALVLICCQAAFPAAPVQAQTEMPYFAIRGFAIEGNTPLTKNAIKGALTPFTGPDKTAETVEQARDALEKLHHQSGYPTVLVNIPEQTVDTGLVRLEVIASTIRKVKVTGNRYFTMEKILRDLPSFKPGEVLYLPKIKEELSLVNRNRDLEVSPLLAPGKELGTVDVELQVKDQLPFHGSLELNNRSTHSTTPLRLNATLSYDNLWQKEHSFSLQFQTSPEEKDEVRALACSYVLPVSPARERFLALYGVWSDSDTAFGEGFNVIGTGRIFGGRLVMPLPTLDSYMHNLTLGIDYKDFDEVLGFDSGSGEPQKTPITYTPLSAAYSATLPDRSGQTLFSLGLNLNARMVTTDQAEFEIKRYQARGNYIYLTAGVERTQKLPAGMGLWAAIDGQIADQALVSNEQYSAGGMESVRGYMESEALGDNAAHGVLELYAPELADLFEAMRPLQLTPYAFYDFAYLTLRDPLPGQDAFTWLAGTGAGIKGQLSRHLEYRLDWGLALEETDLTYRGRDVVYFRIKGQF